MNDRAVSTGGHDIVVVGASAGGVEALRSMVGFLPADLAATLFIVLHLPPAGTSVLPRILERSGVLKATHAVDGDVFEPGRIYVAPPDKHMSFTDGSISLGHGPKVNGHRPAIDPMFRSAANAFSGRVTGVILSGVLDDGAAGLFAVDAAGGAALVQDAADALYPTMPAAALDAVAAAFSGSTEELAERIVELTKVPPRGPVPAPVDDPPVDIVQYAEVTRGASDDPQPGEPTGLTCPECHGSLWESVEGSVKTYRCRTGHEFTPEGLLTGQSEHVESALWAALRALEEKAVIYRRMVKRVDPRRSRVIIDRLERKADTAVQQAVVLRSLLGSVEDGENLYEERAS